MLQPIVIDYLSPHLYISLYFLINFISLENVLTDFEKCEWGAAFLDSCASDKRNNQIQNKSIKKYNKI